jgi:hypothetical protein
MQMIEVGVGNQDGIDRRQIGNPQAGTTQALQHEQPAREVRIDDDTLSAHLYEEAGVADEGDSEFSVGDEPRLVGLSKARSDGGTAHQARELGGAFAKGRIAKRLLDHPATGAGGLEVTLSPSFILSLIATSED